MSSDAMSSDAMSSDAMSKQPHHGGGYASKHTCLEERVQQSASKLMIDCQSYHLPLILTRRPPYPALPSNALAIVTGLAPKDKWSAVARGVLDLVLVLHFVVLVGWRFHFLTFSFILTPISSKPCKH
jgi:hypothetical protein